MDNTKRIPTATIIMNGREQEVTSFIPELPGDDLALVSLSVLKRLTTLLPKANYSTIKERVIEDISQTQSIGELVTVMATELAFQQTVNLITTYKAEDVLQRHPDIA